MRTLKLGSKGDDVKAWQSFLASKGLYAGKLDGGFGQQTQNATQAFQRQHHLKDDGAVGNASLGVALQQGFSLVVDDVPLPEGPTDGVTSMGDAWDPPARPTDAALVVARDPRVITGHQPGVLPCPNNPAPPVGWTYWKGQVPAPVGQLAVKVEFTAAQFPMGSFVQALIDGQLVGARVEWHDYQGATGKRGCFRGTSLMRPALA
jgi:hypothetical protein